MPNQDPQAKTHWPVHPIALLFPAKTPEERAALKEDMASRRSRGLEPLESRILLYEGKILDGRHRSELWKELAHEGACGGYFAKNDPPTDTFIAGTHGTLAAWMRAHSRNMVVRHTSADQRAAVFLKAVTEYPELREVVEQIKNENVHRQKEGKPLDAGVQRGNTAEQVADLAGVSATTVKQVQKLQKEAPQKFEEVAQGRTTSKKALKEIKEQKEVTEQQEVKEQQKAAGGTEGKEAPKPPFRVCDTIYQVEDYRPDLPGSPRLLKFTVRSIRKGVLLCGKKRIKIDKAMTLDAAKEARKARIKALISTLQTALAADPVIA